MDLALFIRRIAFQREEENLDSSTGRKGKGVEKRMQRGLIISLEGISGVGKSYLCQRLRECMDLPIAVQEEIPEWRGDDLGRRITELLRSSGDLFFRNDYPLTTTFLLLSLAMYREETKIKTLPPGQILLKDRSIDSLAVYQAILLCPNLEEQLEKAQELYALLTRWTTLPDLTFLIEDDFDVAIGRAEQRNQRIYPDDERMLLSTAQRLYEKCTNLYPTRILRINRQTMPTDKIIQYMRQCIIGMIAEGQVSERYVLPS
jgi:dTMP kinase